MNLLTSIFRKVKYFFSPRVKLYQKPLTEKEKAIVRNAAAQPSYQLQRAKWDEPDQKPND